jgi:predicted nucleic acid-binding protein
VILVDVNILLYASNAEADQHAESRDWLDGKLGGAAPFGLPWPTGVYGNLVPDAHLAALAIEHGLTLCSTDGDFARFPGLTWLNPLSA